MLTAMTAALTFTACAALRRQLGDRPPHVGRWICLRPTKNRGAAFGLPIRSELLPALSAASMALILRRKREHPVGTGLILGGGLSNLWERTNCGEVRDYLQFPRAPKPLRRYVCNLADLSIFAGALCLLEKRRPKAP